MRILSLWLSICLILLKSGTGVLSVAICSNIHLGKTGNPGTEKCISRRDTQEITSPKLEEKLLATETRNNSLKEDILTLLAKRDLNGHVANLLFRALNDDAAELSKFKSGPTGLLFHRTLQKIKEPIAKGGRGITVDSRIKSIPQYYRPTSYEDEFIEFLQNHHDDGNEKFNSKYFPFEHAVKHKLYNDINLKSNGNQNHFIERAARHSFEKQSLDKSEFQKEESKRYSLKSYLDNKKNLFKVIAAMYPLQLGLLKESLLTKCLNKKDIDQNTHLNEFSSDLLQTLGDRLSLPVNPSAEKTFEGNLTQFLNDRNNDKMLSNNSIAGNNNFVNLVNTNNVLNENVQNKIRNLLFGNDNVDQEKMNSNILEIISHIVSQVNSKNESSSDYSNSPIFVRPVSKCYDQNVPYNKTLSMQTYLQDFRRGSLETPLVSKGGDSPYMKIRVRNGPVMLTFHSDVNKFKPVSGFENTSSLSDNHFLSNKNVSTHSQYNLGLDLLPSLTDEFSNPDKKDSSAKVNLKNMNNQDGFLNNPIVKNIGSQFGFSNDFPKIMASRLTTSIPLEADSHQSPDICNCKIGEAVLSDDNKSGKVKDQGVKDCPFNARTSEYSESIEKGNTYFSPISNDISVTDSASTTNSIPTFDISVARDNFSETATKLFYNESEMNAATTSKLFNDALKSVISGNQRKDRPLAHYKFKKTEIEVLPNDREACVVLLDSVSGIGFKSYKATSKPEISMKSDNQSSNIFLQNLSSSGPSVARSNCTDKCSNVSTSYQNSNDFNNNNRNEAVCTSETSDESLRKVASQLIKNQQKFAIIDLLKKYLNTFVNDSENEHR